LQDPGLLHRSMLSFHLNRLIEIYAASFDLCFPLRFKHSQRPDEWMSLGSSMVSMFPDLERIHSRILIIPQLPGRTPNLLPNGVSVCILH
jgi:hypothetical protein